jgi:hypothetical protein
MGLSALRTRYVHLQLMINWADVIQRYDTQKFDDHGFDE